MSNTTFYSLGGSTTALNNTLFKSYPRPDFLKMRTADVDVQVAESRYNSPRFAGLTRKARTMIVDHEIIDGSNYEKARMALRALYTARKEVQTLVFTENGVNKRASVKLIRLLPHESGLRRHVAQGEWMLLSTEYLADTASTVAAAAKTSTPATVSVTNAGTVASPSLVFTAKPTAAKTAANGQRYRVQVTVVNNAPRDLVRHPVAVRTSWDHAAEVTATRSHSSGKDVEVYKVAPGYQRLMRWFGAGTAAANQSASTLWIADDLAAMREWKDNGGATIGTGDTTFYTSTPLTHMPPTPFYAALEDEVVRVTGYDEAAGTITMVRGVRGSTNATHTSGTPMRLATCYDVVYGWTSAPTPRYINDDYKPIPADHQSSTNSAWTFASYCELYDADDVHTLKPRPASWRLARRPGFPPAGDWTGREDMYGKWVGHTTALATDGTPATKLCISYRAAGPYDGHDLVDRWELMFGVGLSGLDFTQSTTTLELAVPYEGRLNVYGYGRTGSEVRLATYNDSSTSPTLTFSTPVIGVAFAIKPFDAKDIQDNTTGSAIIGPNEPTDGDGFAISQNMVATFDSTERLKVIASARQDVYQIGRPETPATLADADGNTLKVYGVTVALNDTLTLDCEARTALLDDGTSVAPAIGGDWPTVPADASAPPYTSSLTWTETGLSGGASITLAVTSYRSAWA